MFIVSMPVFGFRVGIQNVLRSCCTYLGSYEMEYFAFGMGGRLLELRGHPSHLFLLIPWVSRWHVAHTLSIKPISGRFFFSFCWAKRLRYYLLLTTFDNLMIVALPGR